LTSRHIVMNFSNPPGAEDILAIAEELAMSLPLELSENIERMAIEVDDFPDEFIQDELEAASPFDLLGVYISTAFLSAMTQDVQDQILKTARRNPSKKEDILRLYRRPILDAWCETEDDLTDLIRHVIVREIGYHFDFSEEDLIRFEDEMMNDEGIEILEKIPNR